jgi:hypothetical protein
MTRRLPKLLYVGDIPVEASYQSSIQLHRLLEAFPPDRLCIVETREPASQEARRLRGVRYHALPLATRAAMRGAWSGMHRLWLTRTAAGRAPEVLRLIDGFAPEAVLTIGSGFGWLPAAAIAQRLGIPLHLIAHDDWPKPSGIDGALLSWSRSHYGRVYRQAQSRLCISPFMIERFERRYGAKGTLLYPLRAPDGVTGATASARTIQDGEPIVIGFCGGSGAHVMPGLVSLGRAVAASDARVIVFGPFDDAKRSLLGSLSTGFEFRGVAAHAEMMAGLRQADLLFAPMTFECPEQHVGVVSQQAGGLHCSWRADPGSWAFVLFGGPLGRDAWPRRGDGDGRRSHGAARCDCRPGTQPRAASGAR